MNGTPPYAVAANMQMISATMTGREINELPCINFVRKWRVFVHNMNSTLSALRLGDVDE